MLAAPRRLRMLPPQLIDLALLLNALASFPKDVVLERLVGPAHHVRPVGLHRVARLLVALARAQHLILNGDWYGWYLSRVVPFVAHVTVRYGL